MPHKPATQLKTWRVVEVLALPPGIRLPGYQPNPEVKCLTVGKRDGSNRNTDRVRTVKTPSSENGKIFPLINTD